MFKIIFWFYKKNFYYFNKLINNINIDIFDTHIIINKFIYKYKYIILFNILYI